ncbi:IclR family transcriptional regulator [Effusibacillus consociatus]|uniref:IclR family transcriptional regulator n=1 Tax=Effusibacillus consociatus TaxID=1117041 RepID=A0ABV9Q463_9BACL
MQKYWVPALERANAILALLAAEPSDLRLIDLSNRLGINKSSMYSLLNTMETLGWVVKGKGDTYSLGPALGSLSAAFFRQFHLLQSFHEEAASSAKRVGETIQLAVLNGRHVLYLAKEETAAPVRVVSDPGMRFPAHATSLGKALLTQFDYDSLRELYHDQEFEAMTPYTVTDLEQLWEQVKQSKINGYACDLQEAVAGFYCIAAPVYNHSDRILAAVSFTMMETAWQEKFDLARDEIVDLARRLSQRAGHTRT